MAASLLRESSLRLCRSLVPRTNVIPTRCIRILPKKVREAPNGILFGERLRKPGEKRPKEDWENRWIGWWSLIVGVGIFLYIYKPETRPSKTWAREEALKRIAVIDAAREAKKAAEASAGVINSEEELIQE